MPSIFQFYKLTNNPKNLSATSLKYSIKEQILRFCDFSTLKQIYRLCKNAFVSLVKMSFSPLF